jgi:hypothetical protein
LRFIYSFRDCKQTASVRLVRDGVEVYEEISLFKAFKDDAREINADMNVESVLKILMT